VIVAAETLQPRPFFLALFTGVRRRIILRSWTSALRRSKKFAAHKQLQATAKIVYLGDALVPSLLHTRDVLASRGGELRNPSPSAPTYRGGKA
jgi:hypothetical protein